MGFASVLLAILSLPSLAAAQTIYNVGCSVAQLKTAINDANADGTESVLELDAGCDYLITVLDNMDSGNRGLPTVAADGALTINANGATIRRDASLACDTNDGSDLADEFGMFAAADGVELTLNDLVGRDFCSTDLGGVVRGIGALDLVVNRSRFEDNQANGTGGVFKANTLNASVSDTDFIDNRADDDGGAMEATFFTLDVVRSNFIGNSSDRRGGALRGNVATFSIRDCTFQNSSADLFNGGAVLALSNSVVNVIGSTFDNNSAAGNGGAFGLGGSSTVLNVLNSTFVGNRAGTDGSGEGGAIWYSGSDISLNITNSTFLDNTDENSMSIAGPSAAATSLKNSILDNGLNPICANPFAAGQDNLLSDGSCDPPADPDFNRGSPAGVAASLANNGGETETLALSPDSNALDVVTDCTATSAGVNPLFADGAPVTEDQRGTTRPQGFACDVGAFELVQMAGCCQCNCALTADTCQGAASAGECVEACALFECEGVFNPGQVCMGNLCVTPTPTSTPTQTPTTTPSSTPTDTPTSAATPTATEVPVGGRCDDSSQCQQGALCIDNLCTEVSAPAPALSKTALLVSMAVLIGIALLGFSRLRRER